MRPATRILARTGPLSVLAATPSVVVQPISQGTARADQPAAQTENAKKNEAPPDIDSALAELVHAIDHQLEVLDALVAATQDQLKALISLKGVGLEGTAPGERTPLVEVQSAIAKLSTRLGLSGDRVRDAARVLYRLLGGQPEDAELTLSDLGICFLFAQAHHGAMRHVSPIRQELGFRTIFNLLGPLTNPAGARRQVMGVPAPRYVEPICQALGALGAFRAWSVHGEGMDELTTTGETEVAEWREGVGMRRFIITPEAVGLSRSSLADLTGGAPDYNAGALRRMLEGQTGAYRDIVLLNAAAAFLVGEADETLREGVELAGAVVDDGRALTALDQLITITNAA